MEDEQENEPLNDGGGETQTCCQTKWDACMTFLNDYKAVFFWIAIVITDGRYVECLMNSWSATAKNCTKTVEEPLSDCSQAYDFDVLQLSKVCGLSVVLLAVIVYLYIFNSKSKRYQKIYEASLLQVTEDTINEQTTSKQKDHVVSILKSNGWETFKVGGSDTLENLQEITILCKKEVKRQLQKPNPSGTDGTGGGGGTGGTAGIEGTEGRGGTGGTAGIEGTGDTEDTIGTGRTEGTGDTEDTRGTGITEGTGGTGGTVGTEGTGGRGGTGGTVGIKGTGGTGVRGGRGGSGRIKGTEKQLPKDMCTSNV